MKVVNFVIKSTEGYPVDVVMEKLPVTVSFSAEFGIYEPRDTFTLKTQILSPEGVILVDTESEMETSENANAVHLFLDVNEMPIETEGEYKILIIADNEILSTQYMEVEQLFTTFENGLLS